MLKSRDGLRLCVVIAFFGLAAVAYVMSRAEGGAWVQKAPVPKAHSGQLASGSLAGRLANAAESRPITTIGFAEAEPRPPEAPARKLTVLEGENTPCAAAIAECIPSNRDLAAFDRTPPGAPPAPESPAANRTE